MDIGFASYAVACVGYSVLVVLLLFSWRGKSLGIALIAGSFCSALWAGVVAGVELGVGISFEVMQLAELARSLSWCLFLLAAVERKSGSRARQSSLFKAAFGVALLLLGVALLFALSIFDANLEVALVKEIVLIVWVAIAIAGMALIEQVFRNTNENQRWAVKFLCLGLGVVFAYDFFMYADALLFKQINLRFWEARGFVNSLAIPLIAVAVARNPKYEIDIHVSRKVVFHTATIMGAGVYLLSMALVGYLIRYYGATWGGVLQIVFLVGAGVLLLGLLFSDKIRAKTRVLLSKHFYSYKYDYREEWQKFTHHLAESGDSVPERLIRSLATLTSSPGGMLWERAESGRFVLLDRWHMPAPEGADSSSLESLVAFIESTHWVIDIDEYLHQPEKYQGLQMPQWLTGMPNVWLIVPLMYTGRCLGFVVLKHTELQAELNWEDRDLLKVAGQQAASYLAQYQADRALVQSQQFEAFNRLSAYIVHDLKNILAQQSLIVSNAEKHKHKPEFVDDVIATVRNSVGRMTNLMRQMRSGERGSDVKPVPLAEVLSEIVERRANKLPCPELVPVSADIVVEADRDQLATVFGHIIQNAQEATSKEGNVHISVEVDSGSVRVVVADTGAGMDDHFIRERLFKPFDSTKGLTGMGVGAFESREYIRSLGGDILVTSEPGEGSQFTIVLPYNRLP